ECHENDTRNSGCGFPTAGGGGGGGSSEKSGNGPGNQGATTAAAGFLPRDDFPLLDIGRNERVVHFVSGSGGSAKSNSRADFDGVYYTTDCGLSFFKDTMSIKAAVLIQSWFRRCRAKLELKRRCAWQIFQTLEYAGEHDQLKLHEFFSALLENAAEFKSRKEQQHGDDCDEESRDANDGTNKEQSTETRKGSMLIPGDIASMTVEEDYDGPRISFPMTQEDLDALILAFKQGKRPHVQYVCTMIVEAVEVLRKQPTLRAMSTRRSRQVTICGDIHGQLDDLLTIFQKNGMPSEQNPYIFNGDFVDRGPYSLEVLLLLLACVAVHPDHVFLNRGNHEDLVMNARYGFLQEIHAKFRNHATTVLKFVEEAYRWLPLGTIIDGKIIVVHGGISDSTDLKRINSLSREKYASILRPPVPVPTSAQPRHRRSAGFLVDSYEWRLVMDLLWSDPKRREGCGPNEYRGGGSYFGPDVTTAILDRYGLRLLIRSHECKPNGYAFCHEDRCLTVFSASNYYEIGSNKGAYVQLLGSHLRPRFFQFSVSTSLINVDPTSTLTSNSLLPDSIHASRRGMRRNQTATMRHQVGKAETSAMKELRQKIREHSAEIKDLCNQYDFDKTGRLNLCLWCKAMEKGTGLTLPWRMLRPKFAPVDQNGLVMYEVMNFDQNTKETGNQGAVVESVIRNRSSLETIFKIMDADNTGEICMDQFGTTCALLSEYLPNPISPDAMNSLARSIDINGDGVITLAEFLDAFQKVDEALSANRNSSSSTPGPPAAPDVDNTLTVVQEDVESQPSTPEPVTEPSSRKNSGPSRRSSEAATIGRKTPSPAPPSRSSSGSARRRRESGHHRV
ncbi:unnamed protein product, partial [Notodromas monacha]